MLHGIKIKKSDSLEGNKIIVAVGILQGSKTINRPTTFVNGTKFFYKKVKNQNNFKTTIDCSIQ